MVNAVREAGHLAARSKAWVCGRSLGGIVGSKIRKKNTHNEEDPIVRQGASEATAPAAKYRNIKLANDCLEGIDLQM